MAGQEGEREILFELTRLGPYVKVVAIDAATGVEVSVMGPAGAPRTELQRLALRKLERRLAQNG